jgi:hypothetical protein
MLKPKKEKRFSGYEYRAALAKAVPELKERARAIERNGRPTKYSEAVAQEIYERMIKGQTLAEVCEEMKISRSAVYAWQDEHASFRDLFARARIGLADYAFGEALRVSRDLMAQPEIDSARVGAARLLTDTLKWYAERLNPGSYEKKQAIELTGANGGPMQLQQHVIVDARALDSDSRDALRAALVAAQTKQLTKSD